MVWEDWKQEMNLNFFFGLHGLHAPNFSTFFGKLMKCNKNKGAWWCFAFKIFPLPCGIWLMMKFSPKNFPVSSWRRLKKNSVLTSKWLVLTAQKKNKKSYVSKCHPLKKLLWWLFGRPSTWYNLYPLPYYGIPWKIIYVVVCSICTKQFTWIQVTCHALIYLLPFPNLVTFGSFGIFPHDGTQSMQCGM